MPEEKKEEAKPENPKTEEKKPEEKKEETHKPISMIEEANEAAKRLEEANKVKKELLDREEKLLAEKKLGGKSVMNKEEKEIDPLDDPVEYSKAVFMGKVNPLEDKKKK